MKHHCLFGLATEQYGYFTAEQARRCGFDLRLVSYHAQTGRFQRLRRGLFRLRDFPPAPREEVVAAWLAVGKESAVVSHTSALDWLDLSNIIPDAIHLTVPRSRRHLPKLPGVTIHTTTRELQPGELIRREGLRLTSATRSILDAAEWGAASDQIEIATLEAVGRGLAQPVDLLNGAKTRSQRVLKTVIRSLMRLDGDFCQTCGYPLVEIDATATPRIPCPNCGSTRRNLRRSASVNIQPTVEASTARAGEVGSAPDRSRQKV